MCYAKSFLSYTLLPFLLLSPKLNHVHQAKHNQSATPNLCLKNLLCRIRQGLAIPEMQRRLPGGSLLGNLALSHMVEKSSNSHCGLALGLALESLNTLKLLISSSMCQMLGMVRPKLVLFSDFEPLRIIEAQPNSILSKFVPWPMPLSSQERAFSYQAMSLWELPVFTVTSLSYHIPLPTIPRIIKMVLKEETRFSILS